MLTVPPAKARTSWVGSQWVGLTVTLTLTLTLTSWVGSQWVGRVTRGGLRGLERRQGKGRGGVGGLELCGMYATPAVFSSPRSTLSKRYDPSPRPLRAKPSS